jgi:hypothetical protein
MRSAPMTERDRLIKHWTGTQQEPTGLNSELIEFIADWIITDRKRIIAPLVAYKKRSLKKGWGLGETDKLIDKTIKLAGETL